MFSINCLFLLLFFRMQSTWVNYHWDGRQRSLERSPVIVHLMLLVPTYRILWNSHLENIAVFAGCKDGCQSCVVRRNDKQKHRDIVNYNIFVVRPSRVHILAYSYTMYSMIITSNLLMSSKNYFHIDLC